MLLHPLAHRGAGGAARVLLERRHVGRRKRRRAAEQVLQDPLAALHGRRAIRVGGDEQHAALAEQTAAGIAWNRDAPEVGAVDVGDAVVPGQTLVHERVVRIQKVQDGAVLAQDAFEQHLRFALKSLAQVVVEIRKLVRIGIRTFQIPEVEPLTREVGDQRARPRIREHPARLPLENGGIVQLALGRQRQQFIVGNAGPEEEGQARGELRVGDSIRGAGRDARPAAARIGRRIPDRRGCGAGPSRFRRRSVPYCSAPPDRSASGTADRRPPRGGGTHGQRGS